MIRRCGGSGRTRRIHRTGRSHLRCTGGSVTLDGHPRVLPNGAQASTPDLWSHFDDRHYLDRDQRH